MSHQCVFPPSTNFVHEISRCSSNGVYGNICLWYGFPYFHYVWVSEYVCLCVCVFVCLCVWLTRCPGFSVVDVLCVSSVDRETEYSQSDWCFCFLVSRWSRYRRRLSELLGGRLLCMYLNHHHSCSQFSQLHCCYEYLCVRGCVHLPYSCCLCVFVRV